MKIIYVLDTFPALSETFIAREIEALRRRGFDITICALRAGAGAHAIEPPLSRLLSKGRRLAGLSSAEFFKLGANWAGSARGRAVLRGARHLHGGFASHPALIAWGAAQASGLTWSFSGHARDLWVEGGALGDKLSAAQFASVCTRAAEEHLKGAAPEAAARVLYAPHGLQIERFPFRVPRAQAGGEPWNILSVGRLVEKKGFHILLDALALLRKDGLDFRATIIGEGSWRDQLQQQRARLALHEVVTFAGARRSAEVLEAMHKADVFALPCLVARDGDRDGLPNVLLEAAACGVPLVSTKAGGVSDLIDQTTGFLCEPNDASSLADVMRQARDNPQRFALCRAARRRVEEQFDIDRNVDALAQAFRRAASTSGR